MYKLVAKRVKEIRNVIQWDETDEAKNEIENSVSNLFGEFSGVSWDPFSGVLNVSLGKEYHFSMDPGDFIQFEDEIRVKILSKDILNDYRIMLQTGNVDISIENRG